MNDFFLNKILGKKKKLESETRKKTKQKRRSRSLETNPTSQTKR